ncbi:phytoene desaturase family protein [Spongisporangium articulatum]|uniref:Phytoene desaturase family protein n=1 Tax=Spongisporangium articulatum TaxID=3362603 RepID=A0ABW8AJ03_9ACTN
MTSAIVVGSGPNGLAAALTLAAAGVQVTVLERESTPGGGTRSVEATLPGLLHDECSWAHPLAIDTPFSRAFDLGSTGLRFVAAPYEHAHPLDGGRGAAARRSSEETARALGADARRWRRIFGRLDERFARISEDFLRPMLHVPAHPVLLAQFGALATLPATGLARLFGTDEARAMWSGLAAHSFRPLGSPFSSAIGLALGTAAHTYGWPVAVGGSRSISAAMIAQLEKHGGRIETGVEVRSATELPPSDLLLLDTSPRTAAAILGDRLPAHVRRAYRRFRHGTAAFQVSLAVEGGIPWAYAPAREAASVHLGGTFREVAEAERQTWQGRMPERPFVLLGQQYVADPSRSRGATHPVDAYAHVPHGFGGDATEAILAQIERFAPGARDRIVHVSVRTTTDISVRNPNYVGGDITTGANTARQLVFRPRVALDPYATGIPGTYLCSAATPPGAGAHGVCGWNAARSALASLR